MTWEELLEVISLKRKGKEVSLRQQAELMHKMLEIGEFQLENRKIIDEYERNKGIISEVKLYFPILYREIRREFLKPKAEKP
jgi:hypothetical protein